MKFANILQAIGRTPLVKINRLYAEWPFDVYAKCEFLNPGGSVKDRIGYQMVLDAQAQGRIKPGYTLIEPTSGNTGIGIALAGAVFGYKVIITLPQKMSNEKVATLQALGARVVRTPTEAAWDDPESHIGVAKRLHSEIADSCILDQYTNPSNPGAHYQFTATEIIEDLGGVPDYLIAGAGTGGTVAGIAKRFKETRPQCKIIGVDPEGSILGGGNKIHSYQVEGIGYDFVPDVLDRSLIDEWVKTSDAPSFTWAQKAIAQEGLLCGGSSGSALYGLSQIASQIPKGSSVVVVLPDGIRNYMSKFLNRDWLKENGYSKEF